MLLIAGCGLFNPIVSGNPPKDPRPDYPAREQPENVLLALTLAYGARDSVEYKTLYDSSYVGTSEDLNDPPGTEPSSFRYADEIEHVAALSRTTTISSAELYLGPQSSWHRQTSDDPTHPDWAVIQINGSTLKVEINDGNTQYVASSPSEFFEFKFQPTTPAPGSLSDTLWKIVRWREIGAGEPAPP